MKNIITKTLLTEKSQIARSKNNEYTFEVGRTCNKVEIRKFVEKFFNVKVVSVRTLIGKPVLKVVRGNKIMTPKVKKAIIKLAQGNIIG